MQKKIIKTCKKHGDVNFILEGRGYYRCTKCRASGVTKARQRRKSKLVKHFGGKCIICGYDKCQQALQFHHLDPSKKEFGISTSGVTRSWERMLEEAKKCILVCCRCHAEIECGYIKITDEFLNTTHYNNIDCQVTQQVECQTVNLKVVGSYPTLAAMLQ